MATYYSKLFTDEYGTRYWPMQGAAARFYFVDNGDGQTCRAYLQIFTYLREGNGVARPGYNTYIYLLTSSYSYASFSGVSGHIIGRSQDGFEWPVGSAGTLSSVYITRNENGSQTFSNGLDCGSYSYGASLPTYQYSLGFYANGSWDYHTGYFSTQGAVAPCKLTFDANEGTVSEEYRIIVPETAYGSLPVPERVGYIFLGWFTEVSGGTEVTASTVMGTDNTTVYAHWRPAGFTMYDNAGIAHMGLVTGYDSAGVGHSVLISFYDETGTRRDVR